VVVLLRQTIRELGRAGLCESEQDGDSEENAHSIDVSDQFDPTASGHIDHEP
jgi:hypothetical protein